ncbi:hypothetical protein CCH79_00008662, partial [Gambusia affinis]
MEVDKLKTKTKKLSRSRRRRKQHKRKTNPDKERENKPDSPWESVPSTHETPSKATKFENGCDSLTLIKDAVVVLTKLPEYKIGALRPPTPPQFYSEDESFSSSDSDTQWESEEDSSDSDFWVINSKLKYSNSSNCDLIRMPTTSHNCNGISLCSRDKIRPDLPEEEINVDMMVIARRRPMRWQRGKIVEIITKDDGRLKYKVSFEDKGTCLVSGHHIAFDSRPKVEQLYIGARVVVRCQNNKYRFRPGILAELPSRKNQFRRICSYMEDVLDDVPDGAHKCFMRQYLKDWPYPHLNKYRAGQSFNVELNGVMQMCEVVVIDCSLMQVVFQENQRREWIFRGSVRLEHIARLWEERNKLESKDDSDSD